MVDIKYKLFPHQKECLEYSKNHNKFILGDQMGLGKALSMESRLYTPNGYILMKDVKPGDVLLDECGNKCNVTDVYYQGVKPIYKVTFTDGSSVECCEDHLWYVNTPGRKYEGKPYTVKSLKELIVDYKSTSNTSCGKRVFRKYHIPIVSNIEFEQQKVLIEPYVLGVLLGDGCLSSVYYKYGQTIHYCSTEEDIAQTIRNMGYCVKRDRNDQTNNRIISRSIVEGLQYYKLDGKHSHEKFIPKEYIYNSQECRIKLLQGLIDTDGYVSKEGNLFYDTTSEQLAYDCIEIIQSLGGTCRLRSKVGKYKKDGKEIMCKTAYTLSINLPEYITPCTTHYKLIRYKPNTKYKPRRLIDNIEFVGNKECQCISVDSLNRLYITDNFIVTHNTLEAICVGLTKKEEARHCLVICCVNGMQYSWKNEIENATYEKAKILGSRIGKKTKKLTIKGNKEKVEDLQNLGDEYFLITNIESFRNSDVVNLIGDLCRKGKIGMCIIDEFHLGAKSHSSAQGKAIHKIRCKYKMVLTGTPLMNSPMDLYNLLKWLNVEKHTYYQFENYYARKGGFGGYQIIGYKHLDELQETLDSCMLRRMKDEILDLPPKIYKYEYVDMYSEQTKLYREVKKGLVETMDEILEINPNPLALLTGLRQVTECPQLINEEVTKSAKIDRMVELVDEIVGSGEKVVVFSNWAKVVQHTITLINPEYNPKLITGEVGVEDRQRIVEDFQTTDNCKVLLGTVGAAGTGLTLTAATNVIFLSEPWTYANKVQAEDRCYRIGTTDNVNIITLITNDTIDEGVHETVMLKKDLSDAIVDKTVEGLDLKKLFRNLLK